VLDPLPIALICEVVVHRASGQVETFGYVMFFHGLLRKICVRAGYSSSLVCYLFWDNPHNCTNALRVKFATIVIFLNFRNASMNVSSS
jgi:hypothetical protein